MVFSIIPWKFMTGNPNYLTHRAINDVPKAERLEVLNVYIAKVSEFYGVTRTRQLYEVR